MPFARHSLGPLSRIAPDRRRHKRLAASLRGCCMRGNKPEYPCQLIEASSGGAAMLARVGVDIGECEVVVPVCKVRDVSISGASTKTPAWPQITTEVRLGKRRARVMRDPAQGFGAPFIHFQNAGAACRYFG